MNPDLQKHSVRKMYITRAQWSRLVFRKTSVLSWR